MPDSISLTSDVTSSTWLPKLGLVWEARARTA
jgi:hypothetical protein